MVEITSRKFPVIVQGIVDYFPTLAPEGIGFMVADMETFLRYLNMIGPGLRFTPNEIFASTVSDGEFGAMAGMQRMDITPDQIESTAQRLATTRVDPLVIAGMEADGAGVGRAGGAPGGAGLRRLPADVHVAGRRWSWGRSRRWG